MRAIFLLPIFMSMLFNFIACYESAHHTISTDASIILGSDQEINYKLPQKMVLHKKFFDALTTSKKTWESAKKANNNTYSYALNSGIAGWTPNRYQTIIEFERGVVALYSVKTLEGSINSEMKKHFPTAKTLDELYDECENKIIPNLKTNQYFNLSFFTNGLLASCSYDYCGMMDSEGMGISLSAFSFGRKRNFGAEDSTQINNLSMSCK